MANNEVLSLYRGIDPLNRIHMVIRYKRCPYEQMEKYIPKSGKVLDIGCGHGLFANFLALKSQDRFVTGIDPCAEKIKVARKSLNDRPNINFIKSFFSDLDNHDFAAITLIDVLYLIPHQEQEKIVRLALSFLKDNGVLMIKEVPGDNSLRFKLAYLQEIVMVRLFRRTFGADFYYRNLPDWSALLDKIGYKSETIRLDTPMPSYLFICRRK